MANIIKLQLVSVSKSGKSLVLKDATGAYDATNNPGGYGAPNPYSLQIGSIGGILAHRYWPDAGFTFTQLMNADFSALNNAGYTYGSETNDAAISDGVHQFMFLPIKTVVGGCTFTNGSKTVLTPGFDPNTLGASGLQYVMAGDGSFKLAGIPQLIDWNGTNNLGTVTLKDPWSGPTGSYQLWTSISGDLKVLINKAAEACIVGSVGKLAEGNCDDCVKKELLINKLIRWRFAADVKFAKNDFDGAHNIIVAVGKSCSCN